MRFGCLATFLERSLGKGESHMSCRIFRDISLFLETLSKKRNNSDCICAGNLTSISNERGLAEVLGLEFELV